MNIRHFRFAIDYRVPRNQETTCCFWQLCGVRARAEPGAELGVSAGARVWSSKQGPEPNFWRAPALHGEFWSTSLHWSFFYFFFAHPVSVSCIVIISSSVQNQIWRKVCLLHENRTICSGQLSCRSESSFQFVFCFLSLLTSFFCHSASARNVLL